jgi:hypothetical protein
LVVFSYEMFVTAVSENFPVLLPTYHGRSTASMPTD